MFTKPRVPNPRDLSSVRFRSVAHAYLPVVIVICTRVYTTPSTIRTWCAHVTRLTHAVRVQYCYRARKRPTAIN